MEFETKSDRTARIINEVLRVLDISIREFAATIEMNYMQVYYCSTGKTKTISEELISAITTKFPMISEEYLRSGTGGVLVGENETEAPPVFSPVSNDEMLRLFNRVLDLLEKVQAREEKLDEKIAHIEQIEARLNERLLESQNNQSKAI